MNHFMRMILALAVFVPASTAFCEDMTGPDVYTWIPELIARTRVRARAQDPVLQPALTKLRSDADRELDGQLVCVTDKPEDLARSVGGKHNYASISVYYWPDGNNPSAPWVMRDGRRNSEAIARFDGPRIAAMTRRVITCSQAYYFTGDVRYAQRAADQLRTWFIDPATRMNPNLQYAQCVPNKSSGSPWGIIDANQFPYMLDAVMLLQDSGHWTPDDHRALQAWFTQFTDWLHTSDLGRRERAARNNHGTFYDLLLARSAIFCGNLPLAREIANSFGPARIATQVRPDGSTPHEQERVNAATYTCWNLKGMAEMLLLARRLDVDLWRYEGADGQSLRKASRWLMAYVENPADWKFGDGQISTTAPAEFFTILAAATTDPELTDFCRKHFHAAGGDTGGREKWRSSRLTLLFPQ